MVNRIFRVFIALVLHVQPLLFQFSKINLESDQCLLLILFEMFTGAMFIFSSARWLKCKPRKGWTTSTGILWKSANKLTELPGDGECRLTRFNLIRNFFCKENSSFFKAVPSDRLPIYLGSLLHTISSLFSHFCLFENAILHKIMKLGFFSLVLVSSLS